MHFLLDKLTTPFAFIVVLGVIIFVHEFGHFITAKAFGIRVFVFSFGFGQRLMGFKWGDTDCRLSLIPLGGYVKLEGEADDRLSEDTSHIGDGRDFTARPRWQRIVVYLAGPLMNGVLTVGVLTGVYVHGAELPDFSDTPIVALVEPNSPAAQAGIVEGDEIIAIDGEPQRTWEHVLMTVALRPQRQLDVTLRRGSEERHVTVKSRAIDNNIGDIGAHPLVVIGNVIAGTPAQEAGVKPGDIVLRMGGKSIHAFEEIPPIVAAAADQPLDVELSRNGQIVKLQLHSRGGKIGISGGNRLVYKKFPLPRAIHEALLHTRELIRQTVTMLRQLVTAQISPKVALSGPVAIFQASGEAAKAGLLPLVLLMALISLSVGILNLLPLPPLDGGHLAILVVEGVIRHDLGTTAKTWIMNTGAVFLLLLIATVVYFDFSKQAWFRNLLGP